MGPRPEKSREPEPELMDKPGQRASAPGAFLGPPPGASEPRSHLPPVLLAQRNSTKGRTWETRQGHLSPNQILWIQTWLPSPLFEKPFLKNCRPQEL